jgi:hypothetical protein
MQMAAFILFHTAGLLRDSIFLSTFSFAAFSQLNEYCNAHLVHTYPPLFFSFRSGVLLFIVLLLGSVVVPISHSLLRLNLPADATEESL